MDTHQGVPSTSSTPSRYYWLRTIAAVGTAGLVSFGVSVVGHNEDWPHSLSIGFASFLFLIPILQPIASQSAVRSWAGRLAFGVIAAVIGGLFHAFVLGR